MTSRARNHLVLACAGAVTVGFGLHAVAPALPLIQDVFSLDDFEIGLVTSAYVLPGVLFAVPLGILADLLGRRFMFSIAGVFYGLMGIAQAFTSTFEWLLVWRLCQGFAFAALMPLTVTVIGDAFSGLAQVRAQAQRQVAMAMANLAVPVLGAQLALITWSLPFAAQGLAILPGLAALAILEPGRSRKTGRGGYVRLALRSVVRKGFPSVLSLGFIRFMARFGVIAFLPLHLTRRLDASLTTVGAIVGISTGLGFASAMITARVSARIRPSRIVLGAQLVIGTGLAGFALASHLVVAFAVAIVYALADGLVSVLQSAYAARGTPGDVRAGLVAVNGTARNAGKFVGPLVVGALASWTSIGTGLAVVGAVVIGSGILLTPGLALLDGLLTRDTDDEETGGEHDQETDQELLGQRMEGSPG